MFLEGFPWKKTNGPFLKIAFVGTCMCVQMHMLLRMWGGQRTIYKTQFWLSLVASSLPPTEAIALVPVNLFCWRWPRKLVRNQILHDRGKALEREGFIVLQGTQQQAGLDSFGSIRKIKLKGCMLRVSFRSQRPQQLLEMWCEVAHLDLWLPELPNILAYLTRLNAS